VADFSRCGSKSRRAKTTEREKKLRERLVSNLDQIFLSSKPIETRTVPGLTPARRNFRRHVVVRTVIGRITSDSTRQDFRLRNSRTRSQKRSPARQPGLHVERQHEPNPASACGRVDDPRATSGRDNTRAPLSKTLQNLATAMAFSHWRWTRHA